MSFAQMQAAAKAAAAAKNVEATTTPASSSGLGAYTPGSTFLSTPEAIAASKIRCGAGAFESLFLARTEAARWTDHPSVRLQPALARSRLRPRRRTASPSASTVAARTAATPGSPRPEPSAWPRRARADRRLARPSKTATPRAPATPAFTAALRATPSSPSAARRSASTCRLTPRTAEPRAMFAPRRVSSLSLFCSVLSRRQTFGATTLTLSRVQTMVSAPPPAPSARAVWRARSTPTSGGLSPTRTRSTGECRRAMLPAPASRKVLTGVPFPSLAATVSKRGPRGALTTLSISRLDTLTTCFVFPPPRRRAVCGLRYVFCARSFSHRLGRTPRGLGDRASSRLSSARCPASVLRPSSSTPPF